MKLEYMARLSKQKPSIWIGFQKRHSDPKKTRHIRSNVKVMPTVFFDCEGIIYHEFLPPGQMATTEYDEKAERGSEEKKAWFVKGEKMVVP